MLKTDIEDNLKQGILVLLALILSLKLFPDLGIFGPTAGVIGGALLQVLILSPGLRGEGHRVQPLFDLANQRLREVVRLLIPNGLSVSVNYAGFIVDTAFATRAANPAEDFSPISVTRASG